MQNRIFTFTFIFGILFFSIFNVTNAYNLIPIVSVNDLTYESATINISGLDNAVYNYNLTISSILGPEIVKPVDVDSNGNAVVYITNLSQKTFYTISMDYYNGKKITLSNIFSFTTKVGLLPIIESFTPIKGSIGETVIVKGKNFKDINGVLFGSIPINSSGIKILSENAFTIVVPPKAVTGSIIIKAISGDATSSSNFTVIPPPKIISFSPNYGGVGKLITIKTENLRSVDGVLFGTVPVGINDFSPKDDTTITAVVPKDAVDSKITIKTTAGDAVSESIFNVILIPKITGFEPKSGVAGDTIIIKGENFGGDTEYVMFNGVKAKIVSQSTNELKVVVPVGVSAGKIKVMNFDNISCESYNDFLIGSPVLGEVGINVDDTSITTTSVKLVAFGNVNSGDYHFSVYDENGYPKNRQDFKYAADPVTINVPLDKSYASINVNMTGLKPSSRYVGVMYKDNYDKVSEVNFVTKADLTAGTDKIRLASMTSNSVDIEAYGLTDKHTYVIEVVNNNKLTPNTGYKLNFEFTTDDSFLILPETRTFTGLVPKNNYIASLYKDGKYVDILEFVMNEDTPTPPTPAPTPTSKYSGIVPDCNTGTVNTTTGQFEVPCDFTYFMRLLNNIIKFLLFTIATPFIALIIMYTGYLFITAGGKSGQVEKVRHVLFNAVVGYVIALAAWLIINTIISSFKVDDKIDTFMDRTTFQK